jgi:uncharacterized protein YndB with AHSA1/START domain
MPKQIDVDVTRQMSAPPERLWAVAGDLNRLAEWLQFASAVEDVSAPGGEGATYTVKPQKSYEPTTHWTISEWDPPSRQVHTSEMPAVGGVHSLLEIAPAGGGSTVHVRWTGSPKGLMGRLMASMMQKRITENWERSLQELDRIANE